MLVPILKTILPKTLLKWTTPQSKLATKFKTKSTRTTTTSAAETTLTPLLCPTASFKRATTTQHIHTAPLLSSSSSKAFYISILIVAKLFLHTVINSLSSLMNDFRTKLRYLTTATTTTSKSTLFSNLASSSSTKTTKIDTKLFNKNYKNNHRTYNNSSKSNKVFLYYTPRDPRLRIFNQQQLQQEKQQSLATLNKHLVSLESDSELKITEDLCNYGELIGGFSVNTNKTNNSSGEWCTCVTENLNNNNKTIVNSCDFKQIIFDESVNINNTHVNSEKSDKTDKDSQKNCEKLLQEQQQQKQEKVFEEQLLNKSSVYGHRMNHNCSIAIKGIFTAVIRF